MLANVDRTVRNQWLKVYYQPIVECSTGETAEALGMRTVSVLESVVILVAERIV
ncbi:EAL domain-containing protein [Mobilibacterium timonense]|uniref:EAL domain-containing protein n=1 Tax=Mobilibacterium timonense TaxID=1871012 RepID=UPI001182BF28|nr:EAL domain-containing protein [Mobilibacterium timonense]